MVFDEVFGLSFSLNRGCTTILIYTDRFFHPTFHRSPRSFTKSVVFVAS